MMKYDQTNPMLFLLTVLSLLPFIHFINKKGVGAGKKGLIKKETQNKQKKSYAILKKCGFAK